MPVKNFEQEEKKEPPVDGDHLSLIPESTKKELRDWIKEVLDPDRENKSAEEKFIPPLERVMEIEIKTGLEQQGVEISNIEARKIFWELLAENAFPQIYAEIEPFVAGIRQDENIYTDYNLGNQVRRECLRRLARALGRVSDTKSEDTSLGLNYNITPKKTVAQMRDPFSELEENFSKYLNKLHPEVCQLLNTESEDFRREAARKSVEKWGGKGPTEKEAEQMRKEKTLENLTKSGRTVDDSLVSWPDRKPPSLSDIKRGSLLEVEFIGGQKITYKVTSIKPFFDPQGFPLVEGIIIKKDESAARLATDADWQKEGATGEINLVFSGIMPFFDDKYYAFKKGRLLSNENGSENNPEKVGALQKPEGVPEIEELRKGKTIEVINKSNGKVITYEIASRPEKDSDGFWWIEAYRFEKKERPEYPFSIRLDLIGLAPHPQTGRWNPDWRAKLLP